MVHEIFAWYSPFEVSFMWSSKLLSTAHACSLGGYIVLYVIMPVVS
jgi:hypothetical protein